MAAIALGAGNATHTFNAMRPFSHRDPGILGAVLTAPEIWAELIADGVHVSPAAIKLCIQCKSARRILLISDAVSATGMPEGQYRLSDIEITLSGGICRNPGGAAGGQHSDSGSSPAKHGRLEPSAAGSRARHAYPQSGPIPGNCRKQRNPGRGPRRRHGASRPEPQGTHHHHPRGGEPHRWIRSWSKEVPR